MTTALERTRRVQQAVAGLDITRLPPETMSALFHEDGVFDITVLGLPDEPVAWTGREQIREGWARWLAQWDEYKIRSFDLTAKGDDVIGRFVIEARGHESGVPVSISSKQIWTWHDDRVARIEMVSWD